MFFALTQAAWRLRSAGARFARRPVGLASALRASEGFITTVMKARRTECFISLTQAAWRLRSARARFARRPVGLASALRASDQYTSDLL